MNPEPRIAVRSGRTSLSRSGDSAVSVVYVYPIGQPGFDEAARRFASTYREFPPLADHDLHIVFNGHSPSYENTAVFAGIPCEFHEHDNSGWDIGAFQWAAREIECDVIVCLGGFTYFRRSGWLRRMVDVFRLLGNGLYGASASYEVSPHIRTAGFWCGPELIRAYPKSVTTYQDRYEFEHGDRSITRLARRLSLGCWMVTWEDAHAQSEWRSPPNIFRRGNQSNSLFYDRHFDLYAEATSADQALLAVKADTLPAWGMRDGLRMRGIRSALLTLLRPFTDAQAQLDERQAADLWRISSDASHLSDRIHKMGR